MTEGIESASPALCRVQLGNQLRTLRIGAKLTAAEVVRELSWAPSKLTRLETADNGVVEPADVMALCQIYNAPTNTAAILKGFATVTKTKKDWWQDSTYREVIPPGFKAYLGLEAIAEKLLNFEGQYVPGLLQTEGYIRAIHHGGNERLSSEDIDRVVEVRLTRQEVLHRPGAPLMLTVMISESVLRLKAAPSAIMRAQLEHMAELAASLPHVKVQVMPFALGLHASTNGAFSVLKFQEPTLKSIVYQENLTGAGVNRKEDDVKIYETAFSDLQALAPGYQDALNMIHRASKEF